MLAEIIDALGQSLENDLQLPDYEPDEDFVEGTLQFGLVSLRVYYEQSLSYLTLTSQNEAPLRDVVDLIQSRVVSI